MNPEGPQPDNQVPENQPASQPLAQPAEQPLAQPQAAPVQPLGSAPAAPTNLSAPAPVAPAPADKKKLFKLIAIIGGAVALLVIGLIVFISITSVSKQDYRDAARQFNEVSLANSKLSSKVSLMGYSNSATSDSSFDLDMKEAKEAIEDIKTENKKLGELKAVKVGEGKALYGAFNEKLNAYLVYAEGLMTSMEKVRPATKICNETSKASGQKEQAAAMKECSKSFSEIGEVANAEMNTYIQKLKESYASASTIADGIANIDKPFGSQYDEYKALRDKSYEVQDDVRTATREFTSAVTKRDKEISVKEDANNLGDYLTDGQVK